MRQTVLVSPSQPVKVLPSKRGTGLALAARVRARERRAASGSEVMAREVQ
jgi:hypothetical protein